MKHDADCNKIHRIKGRKSEIFKGVETEKEKLYVPNCYQLNTKRRKI